MNYLLINHSDTLGGASVVTRRLMHALRREGHDARMLVGTKMSDDPFVVQAAPAWRLKIPFYTEAARIYVDNGFNRADLFKVSLGSDGLPLSRHPLVRRADVIILAWVNQGLLSLDEIKRIARLGKPIIWIMHDMWCCTGVCHHAGTCTHYTPGACHDCPLLHSRAGAHDAAFRTWQHKKELYSSTHIRFVAVSSWLADRCRSSDLFHGQSLEIIPNAFPIEEFSPEPHISRSELGLPADGKIIVMAAARLDDPIKDLPAAIDALNRLDSTDAHPVFVGDIRDRSILDTLHRPYSYLGPVYDPERLRAIFAHANIVLSSSKYETLPGTLIEGQAAGAYPVATDSGGQRDIITSEAEGLLVAPGDTEALAAAITQALATAHDTEALRAAAARFAAPAIARQFIN